MKKRIHFFLQVFSLVWLTLLFTPRAEAQTPVAKNGQLKVIGLKLCNQFGNPIQLRGMSTHGIQWYGWGSCLTEASLDALANDWGADVLRISLYVQEGGYDTDPAGFTAQVSRLIDEATERGMYALVDWHQLDPGDPNNNLAKAKTFFTAIANAHKNKNNIIYDVCNEPNGVTWARIKTYADQIIPVIRAIDADAPILVGTHGWGSFGVSDGRSAQDIVSNPLTFSNIMYTFHFYAGSHGQEYLDELDWGSDRLPVFVTEFGTQTASGDGTNNFTRSQQYIDLMRTKKISWTNWNYSDDFRSGAVWKAGTCSAGPWTVANLKPAGVWIRERMLSPADDFPGGGGTTCVPVSASGDDGNVAANVLDNNLNTRWSASGDGQWIQFCLTDTLSVTGVQIAFYNGNVRSSTFDVLVGNDGANWTTASAGRVSSGSSLNLETFTFAARSGKYVRIVGHGNSVNLWNSYTEVKIQTSSSGGQQITLAPQHDAYVRNGTYATIAHGTTDPAILITKLNSNPATGNDRHTYIRFDAGSVSGTVSSAVLRIYGKLDDNRNTNIPVNVHAVSNTTWTESAITWNNKPATGASLGSATVTDSIARYYTWDITAYVQSEKAAGRNIISLALLSTIATNPRIVWNSKETGSNPPQLVITTTQTLRTGAQQTLTVAEEQAAQKVAFSSFPNPFHESNTIQFYLDKPGLTNLAVYDMAGKQVAVLVNGHLPAGQHRFVFKPVGTATGIYTVWLMHDRKVITQKLVRE